MAKPSKGKKGSDWTAPVDIDAEDDNATKRTRKAKKTANKAANTQKTTTDAKPWESWDKEPIHTNNFRLRLREYNTAYTGEISSSIPKETRPVVLEWGTSIDKDDTDTWPPKFAALSDRVAYLVIMADISTRKRGENWDADFNLNGHFLATRPNRGRAANAKAYDGKIYDFVYKGYYALQGDSGANKKHFKVPWLLTVNKTRAPCGGDTWSLLTNFESAYSEMKLPVPNDLILMNLSENSIVRSKNAANARKTMMQKTGSNENAPASIPEESDDESSDSDSTESERPNSAEDIKALLAMEDDDIVSMDDQLLETMQSTKRKVQPGSQTQTQTQGTKENAGRKRIREDPDIARLLSKSTKPTKSSHDLMACIFRDSDATVGALSKIKNYATRAIHHSVDHETAAQGFREIAKFCDNFTGYADGAFTRGIDTLERDNRLEASTIERDVLAANKKLGNEFYKGLSFADDWSAKIAEKRGSLRPWGQDKQIGVRNITPTQTSRRRHIDSSQSELNIKQPYESEDTPMQDVKPYTQPQSFAMQNQGLQMPQLQAPMPSNIPYFQNQLPHRPSLFGGDTVYDPASTWFTEQALQAARNQHISHAGTPVPTGQNESIFNAFQGPSTGSPMIPMNTINPAHFSRPQSAMQPLQTQPLQLQSGTPQIQSQAPVPQTQNANQQSVMQTTNPPTQNPTHLPGPTTQQNPPVQSANPQGKNPPVGPKNPQQPNTSGFTPVNQS